MKTTIEFIEFIEFIQFIEFIVFLAKVLKPLGNFKLVNNPAMQNKRSGYEDFKNAFLPPSVCICQKTVWR